MKLVLDSGGLHWVAISATHAELHHDAGDRRSALHETFKRHLTFNGQRGERVALSGPSVEIHLGTSRIAKVLLQPSPQLLGPAYLLSPFETRYLADNGHPHPSADGVLQRWSPTTDLHAHFAGVPTAEALLRIGGDVSIPVHVLKEAGIHASGPLRASEFSTEQRQRLSSQLALPLDRQSTFLDMERVYRLRGPLTKTPQTFVPLLRQLAQDYAATGVRYVELSLGDIHTADRLRAAVNVVDDIERDTGVRLRFLLAISRHNDFEWDLDLIDRLAQLRDCAVIAGVDFMGHETNSTHTFARQLGLIASAARPGFVIRVHAGENPAYPENVRVAVEAVGEHDVQLRIGHGLFGVDDATLELLRKRRAIVEFNLNSNFALNNIQTCEEAPLRRYLAHGVDCVLGTDGPGLYGTNAAFEVRAARLCGVTDSELAAIAATEERVLARKEAPSRVFQVPDDAPLRHWTPDIDTRRKAERAARDAVLEERLGGRLISNAGPLLSGKRVLSIAGAWANSWSKLPELQRTRICALLDGLMPQLRDVVLITGGTRLGLEGEVHRRAHGLPVLGAVVRQSPPDAVDDAVTHAVLVGESLHDKASGLYSLVKAHDGLCLFIGGGNVVSDEIQTATNLRLRYLLLEGVDGASGTHAREQPHRAFSTAGDVLRRLDDTDFFRAAFEPLWHLGANPTVDVVVLRGDEVLLIQRDQDAVAEPGQWALPGGFAPTDAPKGSPWTQGVETRLQTAVREVKEEAGLDLSALSTRFVHVADVEGLGRDVRDTPTAWSRTSLFRVELDAHHAQLPIVGGDDACDARWFKRSALPARLAFDHAKLLSLALTGR